MKRLASFISLVFVLANLFAFSTIAQAKSKHAAGKKILIAEEKAKKAKKPKKEKKPKKLPEFSIKSVQEITTEIVDINTAENFILIKQGEGAGKKVLTSGAMIIKVTDSGPAVATLADLLKGQPAHFWVHKKEGPDKSFQALIVTQFLGAKALASMPPTAQFAATASQGAENTNPTITVSLSKPAAADVKISYTVSGTATGSGTDYTLANGDITIAAGQTTGLIPLLILNDSLEESEETVVVTLTAVTNATLGAQKMYTYTIADDDKAGVGFTAASSNGTEAATSVTLQVTLSAAAKQEVKVDYAVTGTATGSGTDYTLANGTATIAVGQTNANINMTVVDDTLVESAETIIVTLSNARGATLNSNTTHTYTINDNDQPTIGFTAVTSAVSESTTSATIPVTLSNVSTKETKVNYAVTGGTGIANGGDFTLTAGTLTIPAGQTTGNIAFTVVNDTLDELDETVIVTLSSPVEASLNANVTHTYTIQDNDNPTVQFSSASSSGGENVTPVSIGVTLSAAPAAEVQVAYTVTGTATGGGTDYTLANGTLTIAAGQLTGNISLAIVDDAIVDAGETVILTLSSPTNASLGTTTAYTYTINDND